MIETEEKAFGGDIALIKVKNRPKPQKIHFLEENQIILNCEGLSMLDIL